MLKKWRESHLIQVAAALLMSIVIVYLGLKVVSRYLRRQSSIPPEIEVWYGEKQTFGHLGKPQEQINILGNVVDRDGVTALEYQLNGGDDISYLSVGPDSRRLENEGDFNLEIFSEDLRAGENEVLLYAVDSLGNVTNTTLTINFKENGTWEMPYSIDWGSLTEISQAAQVVDGYWELTDDGVRTGKVGYDRSIVIGDQSWTDYEITVPITLHEVNSDEWKYPSFNPGIGVLVNWSGHTDKNRAGWQPKTGWLPLGAIGWCRWTTADSCRLQLFGNSDEVIVEEDVDRNLVVGEEYILKMRVAKTGKNVPSFSLKLWKSGEAEPAAWDLSADGIPGDPMQGSLLLLAHEVDATFGDVDIYPVQ